MAKKLTYPRFRAANPNTGLPLSGGLVWTYEAGTTTPVATYKTSLLAGGAQNTNPAVLDSNGEADIWFEGAIKIRVNTPSGPVLIEEDNLGTEDVPKHSPELTGIPLVPNISALQTSTSQAVNAKFVQEVIASKGYATTTSPSFTGSATINGTPIATSTSVATAITESVTTAITESVGAENSIEGSSLKDFSVNGIKLKAGTVDGIKITPGTLAAGHFAPGQVGPQQCFMGLVTQTKSVSLEKVTYDVLQFGEANFDIATGIFTANRAGKYLFFFSTDFNSGSGIASFNIVTPSFNYQGGPYGDYESVFVQALAHLEVMDTVYVYVGAPLNIVGGRTYFSGCWLSE